MSERRHDNRETHREEQEEGGRAAKIQLQRTTRTDGSCQRPGKGNQGNLPLEPGSCQYCGFGLLTSRTVRGYISIGLRHDVCGDLLCQPKPNVKKKAEVRSRRWRGENQAVASLLSGQHSVIIKHKASTHCWLP